MAALNILLPSAARLSDYQGLMMVRFVQGLLEGVTYPACVAMWRWWSPSLERSRLLAMSFSGVIAGVVVGVKTSAYMSDWMGWAAPFYFYGIVGIIWYLWWLWLSSEKPCTHTTIDEKELFYIERTIGNASEASISFDTTPWRNILTSLPVWAIAVTTFCRSWSFYLLIIVLPIYLKDRYKLKSNDLSTLSTVCLFSLMIFLFLGGIISDYLRARNSLTATHVRKLFICTGLGGQALSFVAEAGDSIKAALAVLTISSIFSGLALSGILGNHLDIAPRYAGILMGISHSCGQLAGLFCPDLTKYMIMDQTTEEWKMVFYTMEAILVFRVLFYAVFGSGDLQSWAEPRTSLHTNNHIVANQEQCVVEVAL